MGSQRWGRSMGRVLRQRALAATLCALSLSPKVTGAEVPAEYGVKAAFLLNFTRFVTWPPESFPEPKAPLAICVLGRDPFGHVLDEVVQGEVADGHAVVIRRISETPAAQSCQVLFVDPEIRDLPRIIAAVPSTVLTVGEGSQFLQDGGMIAFVLENRRVRFDINQAKSDGAGLKLSSRLLSVARSVVK
ncbi:MAG: putative transrane protein [Bryobacterales bacterium]|nr:putative transrane protein [Bryobacterales bacterium]